MRGSRLTSSLAWSGAFSSSLHVHRPCGCRAHIAPFACSATNSQDLANGANGGHRPDSTQRKQEAAGPEIVARAFQATLALCPAGKGAASVSQDVLQAYCEIKGVRSGSSGDIAAAERYALSETAARVRGGPLWDATGPKARIRLLHNVCNGEGEVTYIDPESGYTVFSAFAHLRRGNCCGINDAGERTHRCRHCPYAPDGSLTSPSMQRLKERIPLVDGLRDRLSTHSEALQQAAILRVAQAAQISSRVLIGGRNDADVSGNDAKMGAATAKVQREVGSSSVAVCGACDGVEVLRCTRCMGWKFLISPEAMLCPQCDGHGFHPCMDCTPWRPPQRKSFDS
jgi:hypothetical protein